MTPTIPRTPPFIPDPWDWASFRASIEQVRGRPLLVAPAELPSGRSSLWIAACDTDLIIYPSPADRHQQLHEIAHQAAHMLLEHQPAASAAGILFPHLDPAMAGAVLTISRYSEADERTAAQFASEVVARALAATSVEDSHTRQVRPGRGTA